MKVIDQQTFSSYKKTGMQKLEHIPLLLGDISNSNTVHDRIQPQPFTPGTWHCHEQPLISNKSFTSDTSQGPVTMGKNWPQPCDPFPSCLIARVTKQFQTWEI